MVIRFYTLGAAVPIDDLATRRIALRRLVPTGLLAVGRVVDANLLCLAVFGDDYGRVYLHAIDRPSRIRQVPPPWIARTYCGAEGTTGGP